MRDPTNDCKVRFKLREIMAERGLKQIQVAEMTGLARSGLVNLMRDPRAIQMETLSKLCKHLDLQPCDLFEMQ